MGGHRRRIAALAAACTLLSALTVMGADGPRATAGVPAGSTGEITMSLRPTAVVSGAQPTTTVVGGTAVVLGKDGDLAFLAGTVATGTRTRLVLDAGDDHHFTPGSYTGNTAADFIADYFDGSVACSLTETALDVTTAVYAGDTVTELTGSYFVRCGDARTIGTFAYPSTAGVGRLQIDDRDLDFRGAGYKHGKVLPVVVHNPSTEPVDITSVAIDAGAYDVVDDGCSATTVVAGASCTFSVRFQTNTASTISQTIRISSSAYPEPMVLAAIGKTGFNALGEFQPVARALLLDTSTGAGRAGSVVGPMVGGATETLAVAGRGGVPATHAVAVMLQATITAATGDGSLYAVKSGAAIPAHAVMRFAGGRTSVGSFLVALSDDGAVDLRTSASAGVAIEILGWIGDDTVTTRGFKVFPEPLPKVVADTVHGYHVAKGPLTTAAKVVQLDLVATTAAKPYFVTFVVKSASADADLKVWPVGQPEPTRPVMHLTKGSAMDAVTTLVRAATGGTVNMRVTAGKAQIVMTSGLSFIAPADQPAGLDAWGGRIFVGPDPLRIIDTTDLGVPLAAKATTDGYLGILSPYGMEARGVIGEAVASASGAAGPLVLWNDVSPGTSIQPTVITQVGHAVSNLQGGAGSGVRVRNFTKKPTHVAYIVFAIVSGTQPASLPITAGPPTADAQEPEPELAITPVSAAAVASAPIDPPEEAGVVTPLGEAKWSTSIDLGTLFNVNGGDTPTTEVNTGTAAVMDDGTVRFATGDGSRSLNIFIGTDGPVVPGAAIAPPLGLTYDGVSWIELPGLCSTTDAITEFDHVEYSGDTLTRLTGRFSAYCGAGSQTQTGWVVHGTFAYPATDAQPILQISHRFPTIEDTPIDGEKSQIVVVSNVGTSPLSLGTLLLEARLDPTGHLGSGVTKPTDECSGQVLEAAESCSVTLRHESTSFTPAHESYRLVVPSDATSSSRPFWLPVWASSSWNAYGDYAPIQPTPFFDTRSGLGRTGTPTSPLAASTTETFAATGRAGVPAAEQVSAVVVRLTVHAASTAGSLTLFVPASGPGTGVSMAFAKGQRLTQQVVLPISPTGTTAIRSTSAAHVSMAVVGYVASDQVHESQSNSRLVPIPPTRIIDTKTGIGTAKKPLSSTRSLSTFVPGESDRPVAIVITAVAPTADTEIKVWSPTVDDQSSPAVGGVWFPKGVTRSVTLFVNLESTLNVESVAGSTNVTIDVVGVFRSPNQVTEFEGRIVTLDHPVRGLDSRAPNGKGKKIGAKQWNGWDVSTLEADTGLLMTGLLGTLTATGSSSSAQLKAFDPTIGALPTGVTISGRAGQDVTNQALIGVGGDAFFVYNTAGSTHYVFDLVAVVLFVPM